MIAVSLMPPVDHCASCEGRKAESQARDIARARQAEASEAQRSGHFQGADQLAPGALPPVADDKAGTRSVDTAARPLLSSALAVQASAAHEQASLSDPLENPSLRLQALQAYGAAVERT